MKFVCGACFEGFPLTNLKGVNLFQAGTVGQKKALFSQGFLESPIWMAVFTNGLVLETHSKLGYNTRVFDHLKIGITWGKPAANIHTNTKWSQS